MLCGPVQLAQFVEIREAATSSKGSQDSRTRRAPSDQEAVVSWLDALNRRDLDAMCDGAHEEVVLEPSDFTGPAGTIFHGHAGVRSFMAVVLEHFPETRAEALDIDGVDGRVLVRANVLRDHDDGAERAILFELENGLIRRARSYRTAAEAKRAREAGTPLLTAREREVLELLAGGMTATGIAKQLVLSPATIRTHVQNATAKLQASTRVQAIAQAIARGEISVE